MSARRAALALLGGLALAGGLAACDAGKEPAPASSSAALTDPDHPGEEPTVPAAPVDTVPVAPPSSGPGTGAPIEFTGVAGVAFGGAPDALRTAWPGGAAPDAAVAGAECHFLYAQPKPPDGYGVAFMVEDGKFVRVDVEAPDVLAPGGGHAGMTEAQVRAAYGDRIEEQPHKYEPGGKYLIVAPADGGAARLVFELDGSGTVTQWRLGLPPQVHYVEGCA